MLDQNQYNKEQWQAITSHNNYILVAAGAGTGKTRVLTARCLYLLHNQKISSAQILIITFTNKASREIMQRLSKQLSGYVVSHIWKGTFHGICLRIIRNHLALTPYAKDFSIINENEQLTLIKNLLKANNADSDLAQSFQKIVNNCQNEYLLPHHFQTMPNDTLQNRIQSDKINEFQSLKFYEKYQNYLYRHNLCDFGNMISTVIHLLEKHVDIRKFYQEKWQHILVDEYQDINFIQHLFLKLLAKNNLFCVGDEDQTIYSWRGSKIAHISNFNQEFNSAKLIKLETNYRSNKYILAAANDIISHNKQRSCEKNLRSISQKHNKVRVFTVMNNYQEAHMIINAIQVMRRQGLQFSDIAILVRTASQTAVIEKKLIEHKNIPYTIIGSVEFYRRREIQDVLAYIKLSLNQNIQLNLERLVDLEKGVSVKTVQNIISDLPSIGQAIYYLTNTLSEREYINKYGTRAALLLPLLRMVHSWQIQIPQTPKLQMLDIILKKSHYIHRLCDKDHDKCLDFVESNIAELYNVIDDFDTWEEFIEHSTLVKDNHENRDVANAVSIMTIHSAKGLEFPVVFLPGWEEGLLPHQRSVTNETKTEEERRLAYVAITRAKQICIISHCAYRYMFAHKDARIKSRFLKEISEDNLYQRDFI